MAFLGSQSSTRLYRVIYMADLYNRLYRLFSFFDYAFAKKEN